MGEASCEDQYAEDFCSESGSYEDDFEDDDEPPAPAPAPAPSPPKLQKSASKKRLERRLELERELAAELAGEPKRPRERGGRRRLKEDRLREQQQEQQAQQARQEAEAARARQLRAEAMQRQQRQQPDPDAPLRFHRPMSSKPERSAGQPVNLQHVQALVGPAPPSWAQGLFFEEHGPWYGLRQEQGGPCGVIAAVQARLLAAQLERGGRDRAALLRVAVSRLLQDCASGGTVHVVLPGPRLDEGVLHSFTNAAALDQALEGGLIGPWLVPRGRGVLLLLYSALLSRGRVAEDFDDTRVDGQPLIAEHGYGTQELVALLLCGRAVANVFDGEVDLDGCVLKGVHKQPSCGLLTLYEHYGSCVVGPRLKRPKQGAWVVCSESHYSVVWTPGCQDAQDVELRYYDPLGHEGEHRLTARRGAPSAPDDLGSLEKTLATRWPDAYFDWGGRDRVL